MTTQSRRIVLATHGTIGSVEPMLGLAQLLEERSHDVVVAAPEPLAARARQLVNTVSLETTKPMPKLGYYGAGNEQVVANMQPELDLVPEFFEQLCALCKGADAFIAFPYQLAAPMVRDAIDVPYISLHYSPFASMANREVIEQVAELVNPIRKQLGLGPVDDPLGEDAVSNDLALYAVSAHVFRPPKKRWPDHRKVTGYFFSRDDTPPSPELESFMQQEKRPLVVTLGSVRHRDPGAITRVFVETAERLDWPMVIQRGWSGLGDGIDDPNIHVADFVPHQSLFPRASAVVHAGGAGTTAAALRAGVPSVVVPHLLDQPMWAMLVQSNKCGTMLPIEDLDVDSLADALETVMHSEKIAAKTQSMAEKIAAENGTETAAILVEDLLGARNG